MKLLLIMFIAVSINAMSKDDIKAEASKYTDYKSTILAIAGVESSYGVNILGDDSKSLGMMQIQVDTAYFIANKVKSLVWVLKQSRKQLETTLLKDEKKSIEIACKLFEHHRLKHGYFQAVSRYNGGKANWTYYNKVKKEMENK